MAVIARIIKATEEDDPDVADKVLYRVYYEVLPATGEVLIATESLDRDESGDTLLTNVASRLDIEWV
jgi:hypothetical protein